MTKPPYAEVRAGEEVIRFHMVMKGGILSLKAVTREDIRKTHAAIFDRRAYAFNPGTVPLETAPLYIPLS